MAVFTYTARDDSGKTIEGEVTAASQTEAAKSVRSEGNFVIRISQKGSSGKPMKKSGSSVSALNKPLFGEKFNPQDVIYFTNQLAVMVETGVSLAEALGACTHDGNSPRFARALDSVIAKVEGGSEFSAALADHPKVFPSIYISLMKASEASGMMGPMLSRLSEYLETQSSMKKKIKGAITYPIVMLLFAIGTTIFLMTFVLPKFSAIYKGKEDSLPGITKALMAFSNGLVDYGLYILAFVVVSSVGLVYYLRTPAGKMMVEKIKLGLPLLGPLLHKTCLARTLRTLGTMIQSGVSMLEGVKLTSNVAGSLYYENMWNTVNERIESGQQISEALEDYPAIPKAVKKMLGAGERSGQLGPVMERVAGFCEEELSIAIKTMTSMIEPAIIMFLGVVVGGLVLALLLPIFTISKAVH